MKTWKNLALTKTFILKYINVSFYLFVSKSTERETIGYVAHFQVFRLERKLCEDCVMIMELNGYLYIIG